MLLCAIEQFGQAEKHFQKSIDKRSSSAAPPLWNHFQLAKCLRKSGKYEESEKHFKLCCQLASKQRICAEMCYEYGLLLCEEMKNYDAGLCYLSKAAESVKVNDAKHYLYNDTYEYWRRKYRYRRIPTTQKHECEDESKAQVTRTRASPPLQHQYPKSTIQHEELEHSVKNAEEFDENTAMEKNKCSCSIEVVHKLYILFFRFCTLRCH